MKLFNLYAGLNGGFGGPTYRGSIYAKNEDEASEWAYELACEEYDSYSGMHGLFDPQDAYDNPEDYGLDENPTEEDIDELWREDRESWIGYYAVLAEDDENIDKSEIERLD